MVRRAEKALAAEPLLGEARRLAIAARSADRSTGVAALEALADDARVLIAALKLRADAIADERQAARLRRQAFAAYGHRPQKQRG